MAAYTHTHTERMEGVLQKALFFYLSTASQSHRHGSATVCLPQECHPQLASRMANVHPQKMLKMIVGVEEDNFDILLFKS